MLSSSGGLYSHNPYGHRTALQDANMFFGREESVAHVCSAIADQQNLAIVGPRRIGKSSLLMCSCLPEIQQRVGYMIQSALIVLIDLEEHTQQTPDAFFAFVCELLLDTAQIQFRLSLNMPFGTESERFSRLLHEIKQHGIHPVMLLDEFDTVARNPRFTPDFFMFLRAQANMGKVSYVTTSLAPLNEIGHTDIVGSPFFNIFIHHHLGPLTKEAALALITQPSRSVGRPFSDADTQFVLKVAGRHPFYIQCACYELFELQHSSTLKSLNETAHQIYEALVSHFDYAWDHLTPQEQELQKREAVIKEGQGPRRYAPELSESSLFRRFVRSKAKLKLSALTLKHLREVLDKLEDVDVLGNSHLSNLNIVYKEHDPDVLTNDERGMIVRNILQKALEQLRPFNHHSNTAADWQDYKILNDYYFQKEQRTNKQWAAYYAMSERDFYRKRNNAVLNLRNIIIKMETSYLTDLEL